MHRGLAFFISACIALLCFGCSGRAGLSDAEGAAVFAVCGVSAADFVDISREVMVKERAARFPAVAKVFRYDELFAFIVKPVGYNGPVSLALVIDGAVGKSLGLRIVEHVETQHYVRDMESLWFTGRFAGKSAHGYLTLARLAQRSESDIVAITGATVTTEAVINGVNAAFGVYQEYALGLTADDVPYMVRFEPGLGEGPVETGSLAIRAYGSVLAEVALEDIMALPSVRRTMSIHSSSGVTLHSFRGTLLSNVLELVGPGVVDEYDRVFAIGVDDYTSSVDMSEVRGENNVFIMYEDNDEPLLKKNGQPGAMRLVVISDVFGQRFTNFLLEIVLEG